MPGLYDFTGIPAQQLPKQDLINSFIIIGSYRKTHVNGMNAIVGMQLMGCSKIKRPSNECGYSFEGLLE
jgi:hypothetical protein